MAAPQQHALTNTSCTFPASPAVFTSGNYGSGQPASCGDLHDRISGISNCDIQSVAYSSATVVSQPILSHSASRKTKPCSLCGTAAQRSQSSVVPISPISPQEQPVVLLHRLEDGLPEGDVDSLRAFGTIRLLPVHRHCGKAEIVADDSENECDRKYQSAKSHSMSPGNLLYKSINRGNVKKRTELSAGSHIQSDRSGALTKEAKRSFSGSDDHYAHIDKFDEATERSSENVTSVVKPETDKFTSTRTENIVYENSVGRKLNRGHEAISAYVKATPFYSPVSTVCQSSLRLSSAQQRTPSSSQAESLHCSATTRSPTSDNSLSPQTSKSTTTAIHSQTSTSHPLCGTHETVPRSSSPSTPMSIVCSPVVQLSSTTLSPSPSQNINSPSAISPPQSPPSPPTAFSPPLMGSPLASDRETVQATCSVDVQPSSPYSPCTLPSLPASPTSLPSSSDSPPSPAPSLESPPVSPVASSDYRSEINHNRALRPCFERLYDCLPSDTSARVPQSGTVSQSKVKFEQRKGRDHRTRCQVDQVSSMENAEAPTNKSTTDQRLVTQGVSPSNTIRAPSSTTHTPKDTCTASKNSETKTQVNSLSETPSECVSECKKDSEAEAELLNSDLTKNLLDTEGLSADLEKGSCDYKSSLMKLVLKVKHHGSQQPQLGSEKKECNKESGIPKIVLTLTGKGPNKEYSCSNRISRDSENCSENFNSKKHKSRKNKRQKLKDREKAKKIVKGDKHKRHLELFGEDSNDSCDNTVDSSSDHLSERRQSRTPSLEEQEINRSIEPLSPEEPFIGHIEKDFPPSIPESESSGTIKEEEDSKIRDTTVGLLDESLSLSVSKGKSENLETNGTDEHIVKEFTSAEENYVTAEGQPDLIANSIDESVRKADEKPETRDTEPPYSDSANTEEIFGTSVSMLPSSDINIPNKQSDGLILRSRKSRHAKNTESGRNSDACLWVSFGVNAPMPLPAADMPSINRIFTSKERTKSKESVSAGIRGSFSTEPSVSVTENLVSEANGKDCKEKEKREAVSKVPNDPKEKNVEGKTKPSPAELDHKHDFSYNYDRAQSSSNHGGSSHVRSKVRNKEDFVHHRHRHPHKRTRKSEESRERITKKEITSCHLNSWKPITKDDVGSQEVSNSSHMRKSPGFEEQMQSAEKNVTSTPSNYPNVSLSTEYDLGVLQNPADILPQSAENVEPKKENDNVDIPKNLNTGECPDNQYYRPKKIRKIFHTSTIRDQWNEKKSLEITEDEKTIVSRTEDNTSNSYPNSDPGPPQQTIAEPLKPHDIEPEAGSVESEASIIEGGAYWKPHREVISMEEPKSPRDDETSNEESKRNYQSATPQGKEPAALKEEEHEVQTHQPAPEEKERLTTKQEYIAKDSNPEGGENEKQEIEKKEKERKKKPRREKRKDSSGTGGRSSVLQEVQHRREVEHEEERGRRLAQEIKGFNWLEQKIKNGSLLSSVSAPSTPTTSPATKETEPSSRTLSSPAAPSSSQLTIASREEGLAKKKSSGGSCGGTGLKGHLQTAVPPLIPSSKVTALPKRRQSLGTPTTPPCSTTSALSSVTSMPSMTVQGALYTCEPTPNRSEHGKVGTALEKQNTGFEHEHTGHNKATLYSSTTSSKATLYGVKDNFQAFYGTVSTCPGNYYSSVNSGSTDTHSSITTSPTISFYGSTKYQESNPHPENFSLPGLSFKSSVISSSNLSILKDHQHNSLHSPKSNASESKDSDSSAKQESNFRNSSKSAESSADSHCSQRFSHKQALLRRAFQEMLKSESSSSSTEQTKESQNLGETEMKEADVANSKVTEAVVTSSNQSPSGGTIPAENLSTTFKSSYPDSAPPYPASKFSETTDGSAFLHSQESGTESIKLDKKLIDPVHDEGKKSSHATEKEEIAENVTCRLDPNTSDQTKKSGNLDINEEKSNTPENSKETVSETENIKSTEDAKDLQANIIDSIVSTSGVINVKVLQDEIIPRADDKSKEDPEVQPTLLLSVLYKELLKTRQEVEKLRKVQELMLTEKGEKKEDVSEMSTDSKAESGKTDENANRSERIPEKRKEIDEGHDTELKADDEHHESKRSKISIRSDLLLKEDCVTLDTSSSDTSQKNIPQPQQASSPALASPTVTESDSEVPVITLESSVISETSHISRVSPVITVASPVLSSSISGPPIISSASPRGHARTSPGISSPGVSRTSPGTPKNNPGLPRASPGMPLSNRTSPGVPISPGLPVSPGLQKSSPGIPRSSPGVLRMSPGLVRASPGILRASPGTSVITSGNSSQESLKNDTEIISASPGVSQIAVFSPPTNPSTDTFHLPHSHSATVNVQPKMTTVQSVTSPVAPIPGFPQAAVASNIIPVNSPPGVRVSPHTTKVDTMASKTDTSLTSMSPTKLRSVFGISSSEVELMPISVGGPKYSHHEPQPQTYLKTMEDNHHQISEAPLLMNAVKGIHRENSSKEAESSSRGQIPFPNLPCPEDPRRTLKTHQYESGVKRHAFSTSDLPDHPASVCKQPPPLKPVSALLRRHSDNMDIHSVLHHQAMYPGTHKHLTNPLHPSASTTEHKNVNSVHPYSQTSCTPAQYSISGLSRRRNSDSNPSERSHEYQQSVSMGMQHPYPHLAPGASVMRSLGPDKASIFPIPPAIPPSIRSFKPTTPPSVSRAQREHYQSENFYRSNFSFFERIREKFANSGDSGVSAIDRLQSSAANVEKPIQPQTFAPRVLVRESLPEASSHLPTSTFSTLHFPNPNQPIPNVMPNHQNHFSGNMHPGSTIHHMTQARLHPNAGQAVPNVQRNTTGSNGEKLCFRCSQPARFICSGCKKAWYCSELCQREDWSSHGGACTL